MHAPSESFSRNINLNGTEYLELYATFLNGALTTINLMEMDSNKVHKVYRTENLGDKLIFKPGDPKPLKKGWRPPVITAEKMEAYRKNGYKALPLTLPQIMVMFVASDKKSFFLQDLRPGREGVPRGPTGEKLRRWQTFTFPTELMSDRLSWSAWAYKAVDITLSHLVTGKPKGKVKHLGWVYDAGAGNMVEVFRVPVELRNLGEGWYPFSAQELENPVITAAFNQPTRDALSRFSPLSW